MSAHVEWINAADTVATAFVPGARVTRDAVSDTYGILLGDFDNYFVVTGDLGQLRRIAAEIALALSEIIAIETSQVLSEMDGA